MKTIVIAVAAATVIFLLINKPLDRWIARQKEGDTRPLRKMALVGMAFYILLAVVMSILIMLRIIKDLG